MKKMLLTLAAVLVFWCAATHAFASSTLGTIDPNNEGKYLAQLVTDPGFGAQSDEINFGKFTTQSAYDITVSDAGLRGFGWGSTLGWFVTNCLDTQSGCSGTNGNFKVAVSSNGTLSGYAWGDTSGWINFGPFNNSATPQVKIGATGIFGGTTGTAGYAWSQNFGWIKFDCSQAASCVVTDYVPPDTRNQTYQCSDSLDNDGDGFIDYPSDPGCSSPTDNDETDSTSGGGGGGTTYQCSDTIDNDNDGLIDFPDDPGCSSPTDNDETDTTTPPTTYQCSDGIDNDGDGHIDFPADPGCKSPTDNDETDDVIDIGVTVNPPDNPSTTIPDEPPTPENPQSPEVPQHPETPTIPPVQPTRPPSGAAHQSGESPQGIATIVSIAALSVATAVGIFSALLNVPFLFIDLWGLLLALLAMKQKHWGIVYDSKTKQPIDPAYVQLFDMAGREIATCITDMQGRYGFLVDPGTYTMTAGKTHYAFPSERLAGRDHDSVYDNLYFGGPITVENKEHPILKNIPMDPVGVDWNEVTKRNRGLLGFYARHEEFFHVLANSLYAFGFLFSIYAYIVSPNLFNLVVIILYIVVFILENLNILKPKTSNVVDARNDPLAFAKVDIYNAHLNQKIATKVASAHGRFLGLVPKGDYYVKVSRRDSLDTENFTPLATDESVIDAHSGYIAKRIKTGDAIPQTPQTAPATSAPQPTVPQSSEPPQQPQPPTNLPM